MERPPLSARTRSRELELFAELDFAFSRELDAEVRRRWVAVSAAASLRLEMHAMLARETELEARGLFAETGIDASLHAELS